MNVLVTGGGGFLGKAVVRQLLARGDSVRSFSRGRYPELETIGVECQRGDLDDPAAVEAACRGCEAVCHVAAKAGIWGDFREYFRANVKGTENVLKACRRQGIRRLVYTSSPSVIFNGRDMEGVDESVPYPSEYKAAYPKTKALAERMVLEADSGSLATTALRPHLIWGPEDTHLVPGLLARGRQGRLRKLGRQSKLVDVTYVDNAARAHLLALDRLQPGSAIAGRAYFISQGEPIPLWEFVNRVLAAADLPPVRASLPPRLGYLAGWLCEKTYALCSPSKEPPITRFLAEELSTAHWFNIDAARRDLGYRPEISMETGFCRLREWLKDTRGGEASFQGLPES